MLIDNVFEDVNKLREGIENIKLEGCVNSFVTYIEKAEEDKYKNVGEIEKNFIKKLESDADKLIIDVLMSIKYSNLTKEKLLEEIRIGYVEGVYSVNDELDNNDIRYVMVDSFDLKDADSYPFIKKYMEDTLNKYIADLNETKKNQRIRELKARITNTEGIMESYSKSIEKDKEELYSIM